MDRTMIERYAAGADAVLRSIAGLSREQLAAIPIPGKWSVQQLAVHLLDSDLVGSERMKRVAAQPRPLLMGYDENLWMQNLPVSRLDAQRVGELFRLNRLLTADLLRALPDAAFARVGVHSERGIESLSDLVTGYVRHLDHHMGFMDAKRAALGVRTVAR
jgi:hypothetical protein